VRSGKVPSVSAKGSVVAPPSTQLTYFSFTTQCVASSSSDDDDDDDGSIVEVDRAIADMTLVLGIPVNVNCKARDSFRNHPFARLARSRLCSPGREAAAGPSTRLPEKFETSTTALTRTCCLPRCKARVGDILCYCDSCTKLERREPLVLSENAKEFVQWMRRLLQRTMVHPR